MKSEPDERGMFGEHGGRFVPEMLISALDELVKESARILADSRYQAELDGLLKNYAGRPTPLPVAALPCSCSISDRRYP